MLAVAEDSIPAARLLAHDLEALVWDDDGDGSSRRRTDGGGSAAARSGGSRPPVRAAGDRAAALVVPAGVRVAHAAGRRRVPAARDEALEHLLGEPRERRAVVRRERRQGVVEHLRARREHAPRRAPPRRRERTCTLRPSPGSGRRRASPSASRRSMTRTVRECESRRPWASAWIGRSPAHSCSADERRRAAPRSPAASAVASPMRSASAKASAPTTLSS